MTKTFVCFLQIVAVSDLGVSRPRLIRDGSFLENDWSEIAQRRRAHSRLGFAYQGSTKIRGVKVPDIDGLNVQTSTSNVRSPFRRRMVDPTDLGASAAGLPRTSTTIPERQRVFSTLDASCRSFPLPIR